MGSDPLLKLEHFSKIQALKLRQKSRLAILCNISLISLVCHFPIGILGQVGYLIVSIPVLCTLTYFYIEHDVHMLNGRLFDDKEGNITCVANEGRSLVDYIIASSNLCDKFSYFCVDNHDFSDHFPLICSLTLSNSFHETDAHDDKDNASNWDKYKWKESLKQEFMDRFRFHYTQFKDRVSNTNNYNIAELLPDFVNIFQTAGKSLKTTFPFKQSSVFKHV